MTLSLEGGFKGYKGSGLDPFPLASEGHCVNERGLDMVNPHGSLFVLAESFLSNTYYECFWVVSTQHNPSLLWCTKCLGS